MRHEHTLTGRPAGRFGTVVSWVCQLAMAAILAQTLFFKFTWAPETRVIFADLGGRPAATLVGLVELAAVLLLLVPGTAVLGALLALAVMAGAIGSHLFVIGIEIVDPATGAGDGGLLFSLALTVTVLGLVVVALRRHELRGWIRRVSRHA
jgi:hypothetical protein